MWAEGLPISEIASRLGLKANAVGVRISHLRARYPEWFPRRMTPHDYGDVQEWRRLWSEGLPIAGIADKLGLSRNTVSSHISRLRRDYPDWFPPRHVRKRKE